MATGNSNSKRQSTKRKWVNSIYLQNVAGKLSQDKKSQVDTQA